VKYYHGGAPRLRPGDFILPSAITGASTNADYGAEKVCRRDRIYLTSDFQAATFFAAMHHSNHGAIYEVEPVGEVIHDPDCNEPGLSFECERAKILRVFDIKGSTRSKIRRKALSLYETPRISP
jgi:hypothetical protein